MNVKVNGHTINTDRDNGADLILVVPPLKPVPNIPAGYLEHSRWTDGAGATTITARRVD